MFLSDIPALQNAISQRKQVDPSRYIDQTDLELDRLYVGSPLIADSSSTAHQDVVAETNEANVIFQFLLVFRNNSINRICLREEKARERRKTHFLNLFDL
jgi:hypothetical protein